VYALVGLNESGKTTVLEAIDHFQPTTAGEISPKQVGGWTPADPHLLIPIAERTNFTGTITIRCGIELEENDVDDVRAYLKRQDGYRLLSLGRQIEIADTYTYRDSTFTARSSIWTDLVGAGHLKQGKVERELTYAKDVARWNLTANFLRARLPTIWYFPNFLFDFPEKIYIEAEAGESASNKFYRALFQDILGSLPRDLSVAKHVIERARSSKRSDQENLQQVLLEMGRNVTETVVRSWNRIFKEDPMSQKRVQIDLDEDPSVGVNAEGLPNPPKLWVRFRLEDADGLFSVSERSLGFRWFFVYLLITTYRGRRRGDTNDMLFVFDEPASNLHQTAQKALLASFAELSAKAPVIYTTHSHHLINPAWLGTTFVVANEGLDPDRVSADYTADRTDIHVTPYRQFAARHPDQTNYFQPILDVLDYAPSDLELVPEVTMVEGKSDFYLLSYYQDVIAQREKRVPLLPGGGAGSLDNVIQLYLGWARPFVALLDSDREGKAQLTRYANKFGRIVTPHLASLADVSGRPEATGIESILSDEDKLAFQRLIEPTASTYNKKMLALGVQEALATRHVITLSPDAATALNDVLSSLASKLDEVRTSLQIG